MAQKRALAMQQPPIRKFQLACVRIGLNNIDVEIDQVAVIGCRPLGRADSMRIMAGRTGCFMLQMLSVHGKAFVGKNAVTAVTLIAQGIGRFAFVSEIPCVIIVFQQWDVLGAVRPLHIG